MAACLHPLPTSREAAHGHIISYPKRPLWFHHFLTPDLWWLPISHRIHNIEFTSSSQHSRTPITLSWLCSPVYLRFLKVTFLLWTTDRDFSIAEILSMRLLFLEPCHIIPQTCLFRSHMIIHLLNQYLLRADYGPAGFQWRRQTSVLEEFLIHWKDRQARERKLHYNVINSAMGLPDDDLEHPSGNLSHLIITETIGSPYGGNTVSLLNSKGVILNFVVQRFMWSAV